MQRAMYPSKIMRITQGHGVGSHKNNYAVDEAGIDGNTSQLFAPFTGIIKKIYTQDANEVWLESVDPVEYPDGTIDYMTIMFAHCNDVSNLRVGQIIPQGQIFYSEGTKGQATGNHVHFECGRGKFTGTGWHNDGVAWAINNGKQVDKCLWIDETYDIKSNSGYSFRKLQKYFGTTVARDEYTNQVEIKKGMITVRARRTANGEILGYMNIGLYNILETANTGGYTWYRVERDLWFAYSNTWANVYEAKEKPVEPPVEVPEEPEKPVEDVETLKELIKELELKIKSLEELNEELENKVADIPKLVFTCVKEGDYQIHLYDEEKLYIK